MLTSCLNAHYALVTLGTGTITSSRTLECKDTAKNKPGLRGSISQVLIKEVQRADEEKEHRIDVRDGGSLENTNTPSNCKLGLRMSRESKQTETHFRFCAKLI